MLRGVWVDGTLRLKSKDVNKIDDYAKRKMNQRHEVWTGPVDSITVQLSL